VVNLEHIKAIIKSDQFVLFDSLESDNYHQSLFVFDLQERLRMGSGSEGLPYELRAFEAILVSVCSVLRDQLQKLSPRVISLLRRLETTTSRIDRDTLLDVLDLSKKLTK
jgi:magnesium transporter